MIYRYAISLSQISNISHLDACPQSMTDKLQCTYRELEAEKELNDNLVYSILPPTVANRLRVGEPVEAVKYTSVTILFSGVCDFNVFCANNAPMKVVAMLNSLYTRFDALADPCIYNVYKVYRSLKLRVWPCVLFYCSTGILDNNQYQCAPRQSASFPY